MLKIIYRKLHTDVSSLIQSSVNKYFIGIIKTVEFDEIRRGFQNFHQTRIL